MEHHDDEEEDEIEYEVRENVDDLFEGYSGGKIIVVAFEVTRKAFFRKGERNNDGALKKRGPAPENLFRNFRKGKTGFMAKTFDKRGDDAKAFASNPNDEKERRKNARAETAQQNATRTER